MFHTQAARRHAEESAARPLSANRIKPRPAWEDPPLPDSYDPDQEGVAVVGPGQGFRNRESSGYGRAGSTTVVRKAKQQLDRGKQQPDFDVVSSFLERSVHLEILHGVGCLH